MTRRQTNLFEFIRQMLFGDPVVKQQERVQQAVLFEAHANGDLVVAKIMRDYYVRTAARIDHSNKWWEYAAAKQKAQDYEDDHEDLVERHREAVARREAAQARLLLFDQSARTGNGGAQ